MAVSTSDQEYYENPELWGENAFTTLESVIDNIILLSDDDSYFKKAKRFRMSLIGKKALKEFNLDIKQRNKAISFEIAPHKTFPYPRYMINWHKASFITDCGKLQVIDVNNNSYINETLQDEDWKLLYDENGNILEGDINDVQFGNCIKYVTCENGQLSIAEEKEKYWVKDVKSANYFEFSDDLVEKEIVLEYISCGLDSLKDSEIKVHTLMEETLSYYIKWKLLESKRNTPKQDLIYNRDMFKLEKKKSQRHLGNKITVEQILKSMMLR
ncbi:hypothetical protein [Polaribacter sp.]|uniref:hypothetical protein n=1 Tax=Polaribacter sp. TaxID=1920175 RepID=UPI003F6B1DFB